MKGKDKQQNHGIVLASIQVRWTEVRASSQEEACRKLQKRIAGRPLRDTDIPSLIIDEVWSDPSEKGEAWIISPVVNSKEHYTNQMMWDGDTLHIWDASKAATGRIVARRNEE